MSYSTAASSYSLAAYSSLPTSAAIFLAGGSSAPSPSNLGFLPVGAYGKWSWSQTGAGSLATSHQIPVRIGPRFGWVTIAAILRPGANVAQLPAYGN